MNEVKDPYISIITVCYNCEKTIEKTLTSILNQSFTDFEYIIIDGESKDSTINIIETYTQRLNEKLKNFRFISENDNGIYDAINKGIRLSYGDVIGILNSDDWYEINTIEKVALSFKNDSTIDILHGNLMMHRNGKKSISRPKLNYSLLIKGMSLKHPTFFVRSEIYMQDGLFSTEYSISSDYDFALRSFLKKRKFKYLDVVLSNMRSGGISDINRFKSWKEVELIQKNFNINILKRKIFLLAKYIKYYVYIVLTKFN